jgi:hypothetical protein
LGGSVKLFFFKDLSDDVLLKKNKKWIGVLEKTMTEVKAKTNALLAKNITYAKAMPEISTLRKELKELREQTWIILKELRRGKSEFNDNNEPSSKYGHMNTLNNILLEHQKCTENLDTIQKR